MSFEVSEPILNSPFEKPKEYWYIEEGEQPHGRAGRRTPVVFPPRDQKEPWTLDGKVLRTSKEYPAGFELALVCKVNDRSDSRFSDVVVCPNVTIRNRLNELYPERGEASIYRTRDLVLRNICRCYLKEK